MESFVQSGTFDSFGAKREQYFAEISDKSGKGLFLERILRYGTKIQSDKQNQQVSLFGGGNGNADQDLAPHFPDVEEWSILERLNREKEILGIYLSGHPLDPYRLEMHSLKMNIGKLETLRNQNYTQVIRFIAMVEDTLKKQDKNGNPYLRVTLSDFENTLELTLFNKQYAEFANYMEKGQILLITGKFQTRYKDSNDIEFALQKVDFMTDVVEHKIKSIYIELPIEKINVELITKMSECVSHEKGNTHLYFGIVDEEQNQKLRGYSRKYQVKLTPELKSFFIKEFSLEKCVVTW